MKQSRYDSKSIQSNVSVDKDESTANSESTIKSETQQELDRLDHLATLLDAAFRVPGTGWRFGLDGLIGLIPGVGDVFGGVMSLYLISRAWRLKIPITTFIRMLINAALEFVIGSIPLLGDLFDFWYKANLRNIKLLQQALRDKDRV